MSDIILHHYPTSPCAEKVRVALGIKNLSWRSVHIPIIMPKPDLLPLTGGYRKTPVMQIGADIYCDTQCILRELERRYPEPSLYRGTDAGTANALAFGNDRGVFAAAVAVVFAERADMATPEFLADRSKMAGREINAQAMKAVRPMQLDQLRAYFAWYEQMLSDGRDFLMGRWPTLVDCAVYHPIWFMHSNLRGLPPEFAQFTRVPAWMARVAAIGHGTPHELDAKQALAVAKDAMPEVAAAVDAGDPLGRKPGQKVSVAPDDTGRDPVVGELIASSPQEIVIRRIDPQVGAVAVYFPRAGMIVRPAE